MKWIAASIVVLAIALVATGVILASDRGDDGPTRVKIERECENQGIYGCVDGGVYSD